MATVAVDALVRERPGISRGRLRKALGAGGNVDRVCKRLMQIGYISRVSMKGNTKYYPIDPGVGGGTPSGRCLAARTTGA
jgi:hypothetical protein